MVKTKVREKYRSLSRQELLDKAYELGFSYEKNSHSCSQTTVAALHELLGFDEVVVRVATSSHAGYAGLVVGTCGGLVGGAIVLDYYFGRPVKNMSYRECIQANLEPLRDDTGVAKVLYYKYIKEYGTIICPHIQVQLFGRHYYLPDEGEKFEKAGAHSDPKKCCHIVGNAARWVMEILLNKGAVEL